MKREDIRIRDPFILADKENGLYYMYGTTELGEGLEAGDKFDAYVSRDLENFEGPFTVFDGAEINFWADRDYWAPEVHHYNGKYYLFGSFKAENHVRATQILVADCPLDRFTPLTDSPITPAGWECLDGTLWVEEGVPYVVFCHEWLQTEDGEICALQLTPDLKEPVGKPFTLFRASANPAVDEFAGRGGEHCRITDGPFLFREGGMLKMIWSSIADGKYAVLEAQAPSLHGEWSHSGSRFSFDGGHAMLFKDFQGKTKISLHHPNTPPDERALFLDFEIKQ